jgi:hypothetical protein
MTTKQWVAVHRKHHQNTDVEGDPHSPHVFGIWNLVFGGVKYYNLAGKDNLFFSVGNNSTGFHTVDYTKIKNGLDRELRKKKKDRKQIEMWMKAIAATKAYTDLPCIVKVVSSQWRIWGMKDGKKVQKLIQFDEL